MGVELGAITFPGGPCMLNDGAAYEDVQAVLEGSRQVCLLVKSQRFPLAPATNGRFEAHRILANSTTIEQL